LIQTSTTEAYAKFFALGSIDLFGCYALVKYNKGLSLAELDDEKLNQGF
jgi:hypothetical protein